MVLPVVQLHSRRSQGCFPLSMVTAVVVVVVVVVVAAVVSFAAVGFVVDKPS